MYPGIAIDTPPPNGIVKAPDSAHRIDKNERRVTAAFNKPSDNPRVIVAKLLRSSWMR